jgi:hypothetical protein
MPSFHQRDIDKSLPLLEPQLCRQRVTEQQEDQCDEQPTEIVALVKKFWHLNIRFGP